MYGPSGFVSVKVQQVLGHVPWNLYSIPGMALTEAVALAPIVYTFCANALRQSDASLESAAQVCGAGPLRIVFSVILPMLRPPIVYSSILVISMSVETLSVPSVRAAGEHPGVLNIPLQERLAVHQPRLRRASAPHRPSSWSSRSDWWCSAKLLKDAQRFVSVRGKATRPRLLDLGWLKWITLCAIIFYVVMGALVPIAGLIMRSFTLVFTPLQSPFKTLTMNNYERVFTYAAYVQSIKNSLIVAALGAVIVSFVALMAVMVARRSTFRFAARPNTWLWHRRPCRASSWASASSGPSRIAPFGTGQLVQGTLWALIIAFGLRALPSGFGSLAPSIMQIGQELDNAAGVAGADWIKTFFRILMRLLTPAFAGAHPDVRDDAEGVFACGVPLLRRHQHHRHHDARALGAGKHRRSRSSGRHSNRDHRGLRGARRTPPERTQDRCLTSRSASSTNSSVTTPF